MSKTLTIRNVPEGLHAQLKRRAEQHHRSLNSEVVHLLETILEEETLDRSEAVDRARRRREEGPTYSTEPEDLKRKMREGLT
jgi:plasmid stability protein